jgi:MFS family permease
VADRFEKRRILIWAQIAPTLIALSLWLLVATGWVRVWHVVVFAVGLGTVRMFEIPTRQSFWVEIASKRDLMSAITLNSACVNLTRIIGPSLAGILIARIGTGPCFLVNALSFLPVLFVLMAMPPSPIAAPTSEPLWVSIRDGLRYMRDNKAVGRLLLLVAAWSLFGSQFDILLPAVADRVFHVGAKGYGFFTAAMGAGALVGAVVTASLERLGHRGRLVIIGCAIALVGLVALALARSYAMALVSLVVLGLGMVMQNATSNTLVQSIVPDALRGRVMGVYSLMFIGLAPVGSLFYAFVGEALGLSRALALGAVGFGVSAALLLLPDSAVRRLS